MNRLKRKIIIDDDVYEEMDSETIKRLISYSFFLINYLNISNKVDQSTRRA
jgi:hypothetical protein